MATQIVGDKEVLDLNPSQLGRESYVSFYELYEPPFQIIGTSTRFAYQADSHRTIINSCLKVIRDQQGLAVVSGNVGTGKSTIAKYIWERAEAYDYRVAYLSDAAAAPGRVLANILQSLHEEPVSKQVEQLKAQFRGLVMNETQMSYGRIVILIDEAQTMQPNTRTLLRLISDMGTGDSKPVQMILFGQQELPVKIARDPALASRVVTSHQIQPLSRSEMAELINYRLNVGGATRDLFSEDALLRLAELSKGIPREACKIGYHTLLLGFERREPVIGLQTVNHAYSRAGLYSAPQRTIEQDSADDD